MQREQPPKKKGKLKRGRKAKKKKHPPKKRGRKPKGGKIIKNTAKTVINTIVKKPNIVLHLKCSTKDLIAINQGIFNNSPEYFNMEDVQNNTIFNEIQITGANRESIDKKDVWEKIKILKNKLHNNDVSGKRSNCFWCTYAFDNPPIYIPRQQRNNIIEVYGCFCSPECAVAYLKKEPIDTSILWERYTLLNHVYSDIYKYTNNIKPAPCPYYTLEKFYGNLTILEYRKLLNNQQLLLVVDKPLTKVLPDLYEENNDCPNIYNDLLTEQKNGASFLRLHRKQPKNTKRSLLSTNFNLV